MAQEGECVFLVSNFFLGWVPCRIIVYYHKMLKDSNEKKIKLLKEQISLVCVATVIVAIVIFLDTSSYRH